MESNAADFCWVFENIQRSVNHWAYLNNTYLRIDGPSIHRPRMELLVSDMGRALFEIQLIWSHIHIVKITAPSVRVKRVATRGINILSPRSDQIDKSSAQTHSLYAQVHLYGRIFPHLCKSKQRIALPSISYAIVYGVAYVLLTDAELCWSHRH